MATIKLKVQNESLPRLKTLLDEFTKEEIEIIEELNDFDTAKSEVNEALVRYESGVAKSYSIEEADAFLEETIKRHES